MIILNKEEELYQKIKNSANKDEALNHIINYRKLLSNITEKENKFYKWFNKNLIYCENTHSFIHRLQKKLHPEMDYRRAQNIAWGVIRNMRDEYERE